MSFCSYKNPLFRGFDVFSIRPINCTIFTSVSASLSFEWIIFWAIFHWYSLLVTLPQNSLYSMNVIKFTHSLFSFIRIIQYLFDFYHLWLSSQSSCQLNANIESCSRAHHKTTQNWPFGLIATNSYSIS